MLQTVNLTKNYGNFTALHGLNLQLDAGDIMGFIGPNGAGKTTTIKIVATLLKPTSGTVYVDGIDICTNPEDARPLIGYMPDLYGLYDDVKVWEYLDFFASAYRIPANQRKGTIQDALEIVDLTTKREAFVKDLSRGMQQRLCLAKTILHNPKLLLLDEPASGLDPRARIEIKELLSELRKMGKTILISSHILPELADFCNKVAIIEQGKLIVSGSVDEIMAQCKGGTELRIKLVEVGDHVMKILAGMDTVGDVRQEDGCVIVTYTGAPGEHFHVLNELLKNGCQVLSFEEQQVDLEDLFMKVTKGIVS